MCPDTHVLILLEQMKHTEVNLQINIRHGNDHFITPERMALLRMIRTKGSLRAAAQSLSMSYQTAWTLIDAMNQVASTPLVAKQRGGNGGGGAIISDYGNIIMNEYDAIEKEVIKFTRLLNTEINL